MLELQNIIEKTLGDANIERDDELTIEAELDKISQNGEVFIVFTPAIAAIPNNWKKLWDLGEREQMSMRDRYVFEE